MPPARLWVFSVTSSVVGGYTMWPGGLIAARTASASKSPPDPMALNWTPAFAAPAPVS